MGIEFDPHVIHKIEVHIPESHDRKEHIRTFRVGMQSPIGNTSIRGRICKIEEAEERPGFIDVFIKEDETGIVHRQEQFNSRFIIRIGFKSNTYDTSED